MKPITFLAFIKEGSDKLIAGSRKNPFSITEKFSIRIQDELFEIKEINEKEKWLKFKTIKSPDEKSYIYVKDLEEKEIYRKDYLEIHLKEYKINEAFSIPVPGSGYKQNDEIKILGFGGTGLVLVKKVNKDGGVVKAEIKTESSFFQEGYKSFIPEGGSGKGLEIVCEMIENNKRTIIEKTAKEPVFKERTNYIDFEYNLPNFVKKGEIKIRRTEITLGEKCKDNLLGGFICIAQKVDYTEKFGIPIVEKGTVNAYNLYNQGSAIIEKKILELEKRIDQLESRI